MALSHSDKYTNESVCVCFFHFVYFSVVITESSYGSSRNENIIDNKIYENSKRNANSIF